MFVVTKPRSATRGAEGVSERIAITISPRTEANRVLRRPLMSSSEGGTPTREVLFAGGADREANLNSNLEQDKLPESSSGAEGDSCFSSKTSPSILISTPLPSLEIPAERPPSHRSPPASPSPFHTEPRHKIDASVLGSTTNDWMAEMESILNFGGEEEFILETKKITERARSATQGTLQKPEVPPYDWSSHLYPGESLLKPELHTLFLKTGKKGERIKVSHFRFSTLRILMLLVS